MTEFDKNTGMTHEAVKLSMVIKEMIDAGMIEEAIAKAENIKNKSAKPLVYTTLGTALAKQNDRRADTFFDRALKHIQEYEYDRLGDTLGKDFPRMHLSRNLADAGRYTQAMQVAGSIEEKGVREKVVSDIKQKRLTQDPLKFLERIPVLSVDEKRMLGRVVGMMCREYRIPEERWKKIKDMLADLDQRIKDAVNKEG
ncbi:MAG: hypothetical protein L6265_07415 [Thermoplasmatales archaeon]|nr:hypothetical protein [Thermoplasmatales archaeon]